MNDTEFILLVIDIIFFYNFKYFHKYSLKFINKD
jgi:hypothetical protein